jgi:hypothetical protein
MVHDFVSRQSKGLGSLLIACTTFSCSSSPATPGAAAAGASGTATSAGGAQGSGQENQAGLGGNVSPAGGGGSMVTGGAQSSAGVSAGGTSDASGGTGGAATGGGGRGGAGGASGPDILPMPLPDGAPGIGFDDMRYVPELKALLIPAGRTGELDLVDPLSSAIAKISGFTASSNFTLGKHRNGSTSADYGTGKIFAIDNETKTLRVVDPATNSITSSTALDDPPDYVRWVEQTHELWLTMPQNPGVTVTTPHIEVLSVPSSGAPVHSLDITFPASGPEALVIDKTRKRAYTNNGLGGNTYAVDLMTHAVVETWKNGCTGLTVDLELDETRGWLLVVCAAGRLAVLDVVNGGKQLGEVSMAGAGVDVSAYNEALHHMYLAGQDSADLSIISVPATGKPVLLGSVATAKGSQMVASDEYGYAWVGDPAKGQLIRVRDTYPPTP